MLKIYIDGLGPFPHVSVGSQALVICAMQILKKKFGEVEFYLCSVKPQVERYYLARTNYNMKLIKRPVNPLLAYPIIKNTAKSMDIIVSPWGDAFITLPPHHIIKKTLALKHNNIPLVLFTSSIGPFQKGIKTHIAKYALSKFDALTVRDSITYEYFKSIGLAHTMLYPDTAFVLKPCTNARISEILKHENIPLKPGEYICINISVLLYNRMKKNGYDYIQLMVDLVEYVRKLTSKPIILLPHQIYSDHYKKNCFVDSNKLASEGGDDRVPMKKLFSRINNKERVYCLSGDYFADEYKGIISGSEIFIGGRMHTVIAATSLNVPSLILEYSHKAPGLMMFLGLQDYTWNVKDDEKILFEKVYQLWMNKNSIRLELKTNMPKIIGKSYAVADIFDRFL